MQNTIQRLTLRAVCLGVSPLIARVLSVPDELSLQELHEVLQLTLGWQGDLFYSFRIHGQEVSQRRQLRDRLLREYQLRRREKFLYSYSAIDLWEWEIRVLDVEPCRGEEDRRPRCVAGRAATPPEESGGARGYMRLLDQREHVLASAQPEVVEAAFRRMAAALPDQDQRDLLREALAQGLERASQRAAKFAGFDPTRFSLQEANERLAGYRGRSQAGR